MSLKYEPSSEPIHISEIENWSGLHVIADFIHTLLDRRWDKMLHTTTFETSAEAAYFDELPTIDALGSLR